MQACRLSPPVHVRLRVGARGRVTLALHALGPPVAAARGSVNATGCATGVANGAEVASPAEPPLQDTVLTHPQVAPPDRCPGPAGVPPGRQPPDGPVTVRMAVRIDGSGPVDVVVSYGACSPSRCLIPVTDKPFRLDLD